MSVIADNDSFFDALSSFWSLFFRDSNEIKTYYKGVAVNLGQLYLELLQNILGTSLNDIPLYSKTYFKFLEVRQDQLYYKEGRSPAEDRFVWSTGDNAVQLAGIRTIANRVLRATSVLSNEKDYVVRDGRLALRFNPFSLASFNFASTFRTVSHAQEVLQLAGTGWGDTKVGDILELSFFTRAEPSRATITHVEGNTLCTLTAPADFKRTPFPKTFKLSVLREPFSPKEVAETLTASTRYLRNVDAQVIPTTQNIDFSFNPLFLGNWVATTSYAVGDIVSVGTYAMYVCREVHFSGMTFDAQYWEPVAGTYIYVKPASGVAGNEGLFRVTGQPALGVVTVTVPGAFSASITDSVVATIVSYAGTYVATDKPYVALNRTRVQPRTVSVVARRAVDVTRKGVTYPAGENVLENIDYQLNYEAGELLFLSPWTNDVYPTVNYSWLKEVFSQDYSDYGAWTAFTSYPAGAIVTNAGLTYVSLGDAGGPTFDETRYVRFQNLVRFDVTKTEKAYGLWGVDTLVDDERLYANFGFLLDYKKPTSEAYRRFLQGVAQLFLLGPSITRFESAMNAIAGFAVTRDEEETLVSYDSGILFTGSLGQVVGSQVGRNGTLTVSTSEFSDPAANFFSDDVGATLRVFDGTTYGTYTVTAIVSATTVTISPTPAYDSTGVIWRYKHVTISNQFRSNEYAFSQADVGSAISLGGADRNRGLYTIQSVGSINTVYLDAPFGFEDETSVPWYLSRGREQRVTTSSREYYFPLDVPMRGEIIDPANFNSLRLPAFSPLTDAFQVTDYLTDPRWWHQARIPEEVLQLSLDTASRRNVSASFIPHVFGAADDAAFGDLGLAFGVDDEGVPGIARDGSADWYGGNTIVLSGITARNEDVGHYAVIDPPSAFAGSYEITRVEPDTITLTLDRFPPVSLVPPVNLPSVRLPPILYRRTVAFVMMDRFLKYHAIRIKINTNVALPTAFIEDVSRLIKEAKPSHTFIYLDSSTEFRDVMTINEDFVLTFGPLFTYAVYAVNNDLIFSTTRLPRFGDAYAYTAANQGISGTPGTYLLATVVPPGDTEVNTVKVRFDPAVLVNAGARRPEEGTDYTVDYTNNTVTILGGSSFPVGPNTVHYLYCVRRFRGPGDPLDPGETPLVFGGADPTIVRAPGQGLVEMGLIDRAVQITLGP